MAEDVKNIILEGQDAIDLWLKGKEAWNEWVEKHPVANVDFSDVDFSEYRDHPTIEADEWPFAWFVFPTGYVDFRNTSFGKGDVIFSDVSFGDGDVNFYGALFGDGDVNFWNTSFGDGYVAFSSASFGNGGVRFWDVSFGKGHTSFYGASFGKGDIGFIGASFGEGDAEFNNVSFGEGDVSFSSVDFEGRAKFSNLKNVDVIEKFSFAHSVFQSSVRISTDEPFGCVVDLTNTKLSNQVSLEGLRCTLKKTKSFLRSEWLGRAKAEDQDDIARFRRLKEISGNNKNHEQALNFNVMEMQAKRWHQTTFAGLVFEFIFQKASDYGRSEFRPFMWMVAVWSLWSGFYFSLSNAMENNLFGKISTAVTFSVGQMIPFIPISRDARSDGAELLFPGDQLPNAVIWLASFQSLISIILIFLIGLSLRNRFKV